MLFFSSLKPNFSSGKDRASMKELLEHLKVKSLSDKKVQLYYIGTKKEPDNHSLQEEETKTSL